MVERPAGPSGPAEIHLVREGRESSLCGLRRDSLGPVEPGRKRLGGTDDERICRMCASALATDKQQPG